MSKLIPENEKGKSLDLQESIEADNEEDAIKIYQIAFNKLKHPDRWHEMAGTLSAAFYSKKGIEQDRNNAISTGDYIAIDIPAPGLPAGNGHDWVRVEKMEENFDDESNESFGVTLKVAANPEKPDEGVAHFFAEGATSTFIIKRKKNNVIAAYHGRNEVVNTDNPGIVDKVRNAVVAVSALAGISELQWKAFLKGLLSE